MKLISFILASFIALASMLFSTASYSANVDSKAKTSYVGTASYYHDMFHGRLTANGERFNNYSGYTAAHRTLPFGTIVKVTNLNNGRSVVVRINDRGPYADTKRRIIDLNKKSFNAIANTRQGLVKVRLTILSKPKKPQTFHKVRGKRK